MDFGKDLIAASATPLVLAILAEGESYGYAILKRVGAGLSEAEAFLVAVKRLGNLDALSREFAGEHSERLWKQLLAGDGDGEEISARSRREPVVVVALAILAALAFKAPELFGQR